MDWLSKAQRERLRRNLHEIPDLIALVETQHATLMPRRPATGGRSTPGSRPPTDLAVLDLLDNRPKLNGRRAYLNPGDGAAMDGFPEGRREGILRCLGDWVRLADEEMSDEGHEHVTPSDQPTITTEAGWLAQHLDWLCDQQWVEELEQDVRRIWRDMASVVGEGRPEYRPRCPKCQGRMADEGSYLTCSACGETVRSDAMDHRTALAKGEPMDAYAFGWAGLTAKQIQNWVDREYLKPAVDDHGRLVKRGKRHCYHVLDVLRLADEFGPRHAAGDRSRLP